MYIIKIILFALLIYSWATVESMFLWEKMFMDLKKEEK